jgi:uncharacterized membrane protein YjjP (DUF1212 family)
MKNPALCWVFCVGDGGQNSLTILSNDSLLERGYRKTMVEFFAQLILGIFGAVFVRRSIVARTLIIGSIVAIIAFFYVFNNFYRE